jgi:hypothetical protein
MYLRLHCSIPVFLARFLACRCRIRHFCFILHSLTAQKNQWRIHTSRKDPSAQWCAEESTAQPPCTAFPCLSRTCPYFENCLLLGASTRIFRRVNIRT